MFGSALVSQHSQSTPTGTRTELIVEGSYQIYNNMIDNSVDTQVTTEERTR